MKTLFDIKFYTSLHSDPLQLNPVLWQWPDQTNPHLVTILMSGLL